MSIDYDVIVIGGGIDRGSGRLSRCAGWGPHVVAGSQRRSGAPPTLAQGSLHRKRPGLKMRIGLTLPWRRQPITQR